MQKIKYSTNETNYSFNKFIRASELSAKNNALFDTVTVLSALKDADTRSKLEIKTFQESDSKYIVSKVLDNQIVSSKEIFPVRIAEYMNKLANVEMELSVFIKAFKNQRKMYKFTQATIALDEDEITEEEFNEIAEKCTLFIENTTEEETIDRILPLLKYTEDDNFSIDELSELLEVSQDKCMKIVHTLKSPKLLEVKE